MTGLFKGPLQKKKIKKLDDERVLVTMLIRTFASNRKAGTDTGGGVDRVASHPLALQLS